MTLNVSPRISLALGIPRAFSPQVQTWFPLPRWDEGSRGRNNLFSPSNRVTRSVWGGVAARTSAFAAGVNSIK